MIAADLINPRRYDGVLGLSVGGGDMMHWPDKSPLEERRLENDIRPMQHIKSKVNNMWRMEDYRDRWNEIKYEVHIRRRGE